MTDFHPAKSLADLATEQSIGPVLDPDDLAAKDPMSDAEYDRWQAAMRDPAPDWTCLRQEYLADLIEESLRREHDFLRQTRIVRRFRKPRIPDGLFARLADQAAWHVIRRTQPGADEKD